MDAKDVIESLTIALKYGDDVRLTAYHTNYLRLSADPMDAADDARMIEIGWSKVPNSGYWLMGV